MTLAPAVIAERLPTHLSVLIGKLSVTRIIRSDGPEIGVLTSPITLRLVIVTFMLAFAKR